MFRQLLRPVIRNVSQRGARKYHADDVANYKPATMDELPVPQGSWKAQYDSKQKTFNMQLVAGLAYAIGTVLFITQSGVIFFNAFPPTRPSEQK